MVVLACGLFGFRSRPPRGLPEMIAQALAIMFGHQAARDIPVLYLPGLLSAEVLGRTGPPSEPAEPQKRDRRSTYFPRKKQPHLSPDPSGLISRISW